MLGMLKQAQQAKKQLKKVQKEIDRMVFKGYSKDNIVVARIEESRGRKLPSIQVYNEAGLCLLKIYDLDQKTEDLNLFKTYHIDSESVAINPDSAETKAPEPSEVLDSAVPLDEEIADKLFAYFSGKKVQVRVDGETIYGTWKGEVKQTKKMQHWQNILQPDFNLHFDTQKTSFGEKQASTLSFAYGKGYGVGFTINENENWITEELNATV